MATRPARTSRAKKRLPVPVIPERPVESATRPNSGHSADFIEPERRRAMISESAYYGAERRGFSPGREFEDWRAAETEIDTLLARGETPTLCGG